MALYINKTKYLQTKMMNARSASVDEDDETNTLETDFYIDDVCFVNIVLLELSVHAQL